MDYKIYIPKPFIKEFLTFKETTGSAGSRTICNLISQFIKINIELDIPTIRKILVSNPDELRKLKELLGEFGN